MYFFASRSTLSGYKRENGYLPAGVHSIVVVARTIDRVLLEGFELLVEINDLPKKRRLTYLL